MSQQFRARKAVMPGINPTFKPGHLTKDQLAGQTAEAGAVTLSRQPTPTPTPPARPKAPRAGRMPAHVSRASQPQAAAPHPVARVVPAAGTPVAPPPVGASPPDDPHFLATPSTTDEQPDDGGNLSALAGAAGGTTPAPNDPFQESQRP